MTAYCFANVEVTDPVEYDQYRSRTLAIIEAYGGRFLVRGGAVDVKEGGYRPNRVLLLEFSDMTAALTWYNSPEYQAILPVRQRSATTDLLFLQGL
jgi:uncharacterized protein (DUF1330 family)